jgi:hypothetical protein
MKINAEVECDRNDIRLWIRFVSRPPIANLNLMPRNAKPCQQGSTPDIDADIEADERFVADTPAAANANATANLACETATHDPGSCKPGPTPKRTRLPRA